MLLIRLIESYTDISSTSSNSYICGLIDTTIGNANSNIAFEYNHVGSIPDDDSFNEKIILTSVTRTNNLIGQSEKTDIRSGNIVFSEVTGSRAHGVDRALSRLLSRNCETRSVSCQTTTGRRLTSFPSTLAGVTFSASCSRYFISPINHPSINY